jgi:hypothetical protein
MMVGTSVFDDYLRATTASAVTPVTLAVVKKKEPPLAMELHRDAVHFALKVLRKLAALTLNYIDIVRQVPAAQDSGQARLSDGSRACIT